MICTICEQDTSAVETIHNHPVCIECYRKAEAYEARVQDRADRLRIASQNAYTEFKAEHESAHQMAQAIPFGQPILIGHHSEQRDRNYRERIHRRFGRAFAKLDKSNELAARASAAESNEAIRTDDPAAILKLTDKLEQLKALQEKMKRVNVSIRKLARGKDWQSLNLSDQVSALCADAMITPLEAEQALTADFVGRVGYPSYRLTNNNAEIRRLERRIEDLRRRQDVIASTPIIERGNERVKIVEDAEANRLRLVFDCKPPADVIALLKQRGFRWSPSNGAWQAYLNNNSRYNADLIIKSYNGV